MTLRHCSLFISRPSCFAMGYSKNTVNICMVIKVWSSTTYQCKNKIKHIKFIYIDIYTHISSHQYDLLFIIKYSSILESLPRLHRFYFEDKHKFTDLLKPGTDSYVCHLKSLMENFKIISMCDGRTGIS